MRTTEISTQIDGTLAEVLQLLSHFDQEQMNVIPFEGSWTAGQLAQHLILSNSGFVEAMNGPVEETQRKPDEMAEKIKSDFLDFTTKMKSPDFTVPAKTSYNKENILDTLEDIKAKVNQAIETQDLTKTCVALKLPVYGTLTRLEVVCFMTYHTQRHIHQLKNIYQKVVHK